MTQILKTSKGNCLPLRHCHLVNRGHLLWPEGFDRLLKLYHNGFSSLGEGGKNTIRAQISEEAEIKQSEPEISGRRICGEGAR